MTDAGTNSDTHFMLGEISANVRNLLAAHDRHREDTQQQFTAVQHRLNGHNERITKVEQGYWRVVGIASVVPVLLTVTGLAISYFT